MCWPEANEPYDKFLKAEKTFWANVHDLLVVSSKDKYSIVYRSKQTNVNMIERIYLSKKEKKIVSIIIDPTFESLNQVLRVHAQDKQFEDKITNFQSAKDIVFNMEKVRNIVGQAALAVKLQYGL